MNPELAFSKEHQLVTIRNLFIWLKAQGGRSSHYNVWDHDTLSQAFGEDIANRAREAFQAFWRTQAPELWSNRPPEQRNSSPYNWIYGLCGVYAEAMSPGWAAALNAEEVRLATVYATIELNGFAPWIRDLVQLRAAEVEAVLGKELDAELAVGGDHDYLRVLQDLSHADFSVKCLLAPRLLARLATLGTAADDIAATRWAGHFERVVRVLEEATVGEDRLEFARECERRFASAPTKPVARAWLHGIFRLDTERGAHVLENALAGLDVNERPTLAVKSLAALFGDDRGEIAEIIDPSRRSATLCQLVRCAYTYVRPADDKKHEGSYTPNARDHAESARSFLMTALQDTPGLNTYRALLELAEDPLFADISDRLRLAARQRAAQDAEFPPLTPPDVVALGGQLEVPPHDCDGLYAVMTGRLDDLAHDLAHDDFTDRRTLRTIKHESEMQLSLAGRLRDRARGAYTVTREDEVADRKKPDIRLATLRGQQRAAIEVKIADHWSIADFELALRIQLVGQYLRHDSCRIGCLLLTYHGEQKHWRYPKSRTNLNFHDVIHHLCQLAEKIEAEQDYCIRLLVKGLDLTDPQLPPAHRP